MLKPDIAEGIMSRLVDKDSKNTKWELQSLEDFFLEKDGFVL